MTEIYTAYQVIQICIMRLGQCMEGIQIKVGLTFPTIPACSLGGQVRKRLIYKFQKNPKSYVSPPLGVFITDKAVQPSNYVTSINQSVKSFLERANSTIIGVSFTSSNAVASLQYTTANE